MAKTVRAIFNLDSDLYPMTVTGKNLTSGELENGAFVAVGKLVDGELGRETYELKKLTGEAGEVLGFVSDPCLMYDVREDERDFVCGQNEVIRTYLPNQTTVGTFAVKHFEEGNSINKGEKLYVKTGKTVLTKENGGSQTPVAEVIDKVTFEGQESLVIKFIK